MPDSPTVDPRFACHHCGEEHVFDGYYVRAEVWKETGLPRVGYLLHIHCLEKVIGRSLTINDFTDGAINTLIRVGYEIAKRELDELSNNGPEPRTPNQ